MLERNGRDVMVHDVFISYSSGDKPTADAVCAGLEQRGIRCWIAPRDILPSQVWSEAIMDAITASRLAVVIVSAHSNTSQQVIREVERAVSQGKPILPFRIENVELSKSLEYFLSTPHWLDAITPPLERHIRKMSETVKALLGREVEEEPVADQRDEREIVEVPPDEWSGGRVSRFFRSLLQDR